MELLCLFSDAMTLLVVIAIFVGCALAQGPVLRENPFKHGLLYKPEGELVISTSSWNLVIVMELQQAETQLSVLQETNSKITHEFAALSRAPTRTTAIYIERLLKGLATRMEEIRMLSSNNLPDHALQSPQKRSIESMLGLQQAIPDHNVRQAIVESMVREDKIITQSEYHTTVIKNVTGEVYKQQKQIEALINVTRGIEQALNFVQQQENQTMIKGMLLLNAFTHLTDGSILLQLYLQQLQEIIMSLHQHQVHPAFVTPKELQEALQEIERNLPKQVVLAIPASNVQEYYALNIATQLNGQGQIVGMVKIPLTTEQQKFLLYHAIPFPYTISQESKPQNETPRQSSYGNRVQWIGPATLFAISSDQSHSLEVKSLLSFRKCLSSQPLICLMDDIINYKQKDSCPFQTMTERVADQPAWKVCHFRKVSKDESTIIPITEQLWAVSPGEPMSMKGKCLDPTNTKRGELAFKEVWITQEQLVQIPGYCTATIGSSWIPYRLHIKGKLRRQNPSDDLDFYDPEYTMSIYDSKIGLKELIQSGRAQLLTLEEWVKKTAQEAVFVHSHIQNHLSHEDLHTDEDKLNHTQVIMYSTGTAIVTAIGFIAALCLFRWFYTKRRSGETILNLSTRGEPVIDNRGTPSIRSQEPLTRAHYRVADELVQVQMREPEDPLPMTPCISNTGDEAAEITLRRIRGEPSNYSMLPTSPTNPEEEDQYTQLAKTH